MTGYRDLEPTSGFFSHDGSVLAVAHQHVITLWDSSTLALRSTLCAWPATEKIRYEDMEGEGILKETNGDISSGMGRDSGESHIYILLLM